jgi:hypothetical protein
MTVAVSVNMSTIAATAFTTGETPSLGNVGVPDNRRAAQGRPSTKADDVG